MNTIDDYFKNGLLDACITPPETIIGGEL